MTRLMQPVPQLEPLQPKQQMTAKKSETIAFESPDKHEGVRR